MSYSVSTLLIRNLRDVFGENDPARSEEHTSELQSRLHLVCRLLLEKKKNTLTTRTTQSCISIPSSYCPSTYHQPGYHRLTLNILLTFPPLTAVVKHPNASIVSHATHLVKLILEDMRF